MIGREFAQQVGAQMMTQRQVRYANLGNVLTLFSATGLSESERLEVALMLQKTIVEGFAKGVDIPRLMAMKAKQEGTLNVGFNDSAIPHRNSIQLDRDFWRTRPDSARLGEFMNRLGARLSSSSSATQPPRGNYAPRQFQEKPRSGTLRNRMMQKQINQVAARIAKIIPPKQAMTSVFKQLADYQGRQNIPAPRMMQQQLHTQNMPLPELPTPEETRSQMVARGADPLSLPQVARSGPGSPRPINSVSPLQAMQASGRPQKALVWAGGGVWGAEADESASILEGMGVAVDKVTSLSGIDYSQYAAIIVPGGSANSEYAAMGSSEATRLAEAVNGGLNYLGFCAGAFLAGEYGSWGLGLTQEAYDVVGGVNNTGSPKIDLQNIPGYDSNNDRYVHEEGGPILNPGGGTVLGTFDTGEVWGKQTTYGAGDVVLISGHPSIPYSGDPDGADTELTKALFNIVMGGSTPGPNDPNNPNGPPGGTNTYNIAPPTVTPPPASTFGTPGRGGASRAPFRKTPVAGVLPSGIVQPSFQAQLQAIMEGSTPTLQGMAGALLKGAK